MSKTEQAEAVLYYEVYTAIKRCEMECDLTPNQICGTLDNIKFQILKDSNEIDDDDETEEYEA